MKTVLGMTQSACPTCRKIVPAKIVEEGRKVFFRKICPTHGPSEAFVHGDVEAYRTAQRYVKPAWEPKVSAGNSKAPCPEGCGFCDRHEQHLCMPIIEITSRCNFHCPICINSSGEAKRDLSLEDFRKMLDRLIAAEGQIDVLNLSGGEPLLHPNLLDMVDETLKRPEIVRVSISTNGRRLLEKPSLTADLRRRNVVASLQLDGFNDATSRELRGMPLAEEKRKILALLEKEGISTSLTFTMVGGVNDREIRPVLDLLFEKPHILSLMIQPMAFAGRAAGFGGSSRRLSIPDVIVALGKAGHPAITKADFVPLPCSHPLCFSLAFYLMLDKGGSVSMNRLVEADTMMDSLSNRVVFGLAPEEHERLKAMIYDLWSGPAGAVPESQVVLGTIKNLLKDMTGASCGRFDPRKAFALAERKIKSIFIHAFQDVDTFDLSRVRRCCQAYPQPDGKLLPACVRNVLVLGGSR